MPHTPQLKWLVRRTNEGHEESTAVADPFLGKIRFVADPGLSGHGESQDCGTSEATDGEIARQQRRRGGPETDGSAAAVRAGGRKVPVESLEIRWTGRRDAVPVGRCERDRLR